MHQQIHIVAFIMFPLSDRPFDFLGGGGGVGAGLLLFFLPEDHAIFHQVESHDIFFGQSESSCLITIRIMLNFSFINLDDSIGLISALHC